MNTEETPTSQPAVELCDQGAPVAERARRIAAARGTRGMTLIEILVVLAIIGLIVGAISIAAFSQLKDSKVATAGNDIATLAQSVEMYQLQKSKCPKTTQDLKAAGIIKKVTKDPWGNDYVIKCPGEHGAVDISSAGEDREMDTEDDINSWDEGSAKGDDEED